MGYTENLTEHVQITLNIMYLLTEPHDTIFCVSVITLHEPAYESCPHTSLLHYCKWRQQFPSKCWYLSIRYL